MKYITIGIWIFLGMIINSITFAFRFTQDIMFEEFCLINDGFSYFMLFTIIEIVFLLILIGFRLYYKKKEVQE